MTDDHLNAYLGQVDRLPTLGSDEMRELVDLLRREGPDSSASTREAALKRLIEGNLQTVIATARQYHGQGPSEVELLEAGNTGLVKAVHTFDWTRDDFPEHAADAIRAAIVEAISS
jgi:DNA-directed RNA polymerase sigma subunit (sigma70/sigma32)